MYSPWFWPKRTRQESLFSEPTVEKHCPALLRCEVKNQQKCRFNMFQVRQSYVKSLLPVGLLRRSQGILMVYYDSDCSCSRGSTLLFFPDVSDLVFNGLDWTAQSSIHLVEFRSVMLATLRSLCPKDWDTDHEAHG